MSDRINKAVEKFEKEGCSCSQSVFSAYSESLGLDENIALKIASSFGGGMGHRGETCGVVTGAFMVLGLKYGKTKRLTDEEKLLIDNKIKDFVEEFKLRNGHIQCKDLLGYDVSVPEQRKQLIEQKLTSKLCPKFVKDSAEILEKLLS